MRRRLSGVRCANATTGSAIAAAKVACRSGKAHRQRDRQVQEGWKKEAEAGSAKGPSSPPRATKNGKKADPVQAMLDRVGQMGSIGTAGMVAAVGATAARAARLTLRPEDVARQQARTHCQVAPVNDHLADVARGDSRHRHAGERRPSIGWCDSYRTLVFDNFHKQPKVFEQRRQAWIDIYASWTKAGSQFDQQDRLINWLELAIRSATPDTIGPMPAKPEFEPAPLEA